MADLGTLMASLGADLTPLVQSVVLAQAEFEKYQKAGKAALDGVNNSVNTAKSGMEGLESIIKKVAAAFSLYKLANAAKDATLLAARYETMGVVMNQMGKTANYSAAEMAKFEKGLAKTGISIVESRESLAKLVQAHVDLRESEKLARIAQDAAVIGNMNSSEAFGQLVYGIQSANLHVLRTIGINVSFEQSYASLAKQLGKTQNELTQQEKTQARLNAVMEQGETIARVYEAAMGTAGKQLNSMKRYVQDLQVALGDALLPAFTEIVTQVTATFKEVQAWMNSNKKEIAEWGQEFASTVKKVIDITSTLLPILADVGSKLLLLYGVSKVVPVLINVAEALLAVNAAAVTLNTTLSMGLIAGFFINALIEGADNAKQAKQQFEDLSDQMSILSRQAESGKIKLLDRETIGKDIRILTSFKSTLEAAKKDLEKIPVDERWDADFVIALEKINKKLKETNETLAAFKNQLININTPNIGSWGGSENVYGAGTNVLIDAREKLTKSTDEYVVSLRKAAEYEAKLKSVQGGVYDLLIKAGRAAEAEDYIKQKMKDWQQAQDKAISDAEKAAESYKKAMEKLNDAWAKLSMSAADYERYEVAKFFKEEAEELGATNPLLQKMLDLKLKLIAANEQLKNPYLPEGYYTKQTDMFQGKKEADKRGEADYENQGNAAANARVALEEDVTRRINELTLSAKDFKIWCLDQEMEKRIEAAGEDKELAAEIAYQYRLEMKDIEESNNMWLDISKQTAKEIQKAFSELFFDAMNGKITDLKSAWNAMMQFLYKVTSDYMGQIAKEMLMGKTVGDKGGSLGGLAGWLSGLFGGGAGGGAAAGAKDLTSLGGGIENAGGGVFGWHGGGKVGFGGGSFYRTMNLSEPLIAQLPRHHKGLAPDERLGVFQTGERILNRKETTEYEREKNKKTVNATPTTIFNMTVNAMDADSFNSKIYQSREVIAAALMQARNSNHPVRRS